MKHSREDRSADSDKSDQDSFIGRWSRRKRDAAVDTPAPVIEEPVVKPDHPIQTQETSDAASDGSVESQLPPVLTDADMPDIETLNADSDFSPFFSEGVTKELRNLALKKLFFSGKFSARDGLDDYDDDFTKFEPLGDTVTSDMKYHARRKEKARLAALEEEERLKLENAGQVSDDEALVAEATDEPEGSDAEIETAETEIAEVDSVDQNEHVELQSDTIDSTVNVSDAETAADEKQQNV